MSDLDDATRARAESRRGDLFHDPIDCRSCRGDHKYARLCAENRQGADAGRLTLAERAAIGASPDAERVSPERPGQWSDGWVIRFPDGSASARSDGRWPYIASAYNEVRALTDDAVEWLLDNDCAVVLARPAAVVAYSPGEVAS